jgi:hypothetical protein
MNKEIAPIEFIVGPIDSYSCSWCGEGVQRIGYFWGDDEEPVYCSESHAIEAREKSSA